MGTLTDRTVLVTGGNGGIGLALAEGCAAEGADVVVWGTNAEKLDAAADVLAGYGTRVSARRVDVRDRAAVDEGFAAAVEELGRVDAVFANAGIHAAVPFVDQQRADWEQMFDVNVYGVLHTLQAAARHMIDRGAGGSLVGVGSISTIHGAPAAQPYAASKAAVVAMMRGLAVELARYHIRCNTIIPGWTVSDMSETGRGSDKFVEATTRRIPVRRWGETADFRRVAAFLADPTQLFHTGDQLVVDGGYTRF